MISSKPDWDFKFSQASYCKESLAAHNFLHSKNLIKGFQHEANYDNNTGKNI